MNSSQNKTRTLNRASKDTKIPEVHISVVTIPIVREPSFKSELHFPVNSSTNKSKRLSPAWVPEDSGSVTDPGGRSPTTPAGQRSFMGRLGKKSVKDNIRLDIRRSSDSLHHRSDDTLSLKSFREGTLSPFVNMSPWFRKKFLDRQESNRRQLTTCKDLGGSDCQGWLWKKNEGSGSKAKKWSIRWFELDRKTLRFYKHEDDSDPLGIISLPGLKISPAPEVKNKKYAFKAHHSGTTFLFAAESRDEMVKWMNKMGLASLEALDLSRASTTAGFQKHESPFHFDEDDNSDNSSRSESDDVDSVDSFGSRLSSRPNSQRSSFAGSREDIIDFYAKLYDANLALDGSNIKDKRSTALFSSIGQTEEEQIAYQRYLTLRRTLQDKEDQLKAINNFLQTNPIKPSDIEAFRKTNPHIFTEFEEETARRENNQYTNDSILEEESNTPNNETSINCEHPSPFPSSPKFSSDR